MFTPRIVRKIRTLLVFVPEVTEASKLFRYRGDLSPVGLSNDNYGLLESYPVEQIEGIPNHWQIAQRQETFCPLRSQLGESAAGASGHYHGLELWFHLEILGKTSW